MHAKIIKRKYKQNILQNMQKICAQSGCPIPTFQKLTTLCIPSSIRDMLAFGTYNMNVSRESKLSKHRYISQILCNTYNKQIQYKNAINITMSHECKYLLNADVYRFSLLQSRLLVTCYLDSDPFCAYLACFHQRVPRELPRSNTSPLTNNIPQLFWIKELPL